MVTCLTLGYFGIIMNILEKLTVCNGKIFPTRYWKDIYSFCILKFKYKPIWSKTDHQSRDAPDRSSRNYDEILLFYFQMLCKPTAQLLYSRLSAIATISPDVVTSVLIGIGLSSHRILSFDACAQQPDVHVSIDPPFCTACMYFRLFYVMDIKVTKYHIKTTYTLCNTWN